MKDFLRSIISKALRLSPIALLASSAFAESLVIPVGKDASLIRESRCCSNPSNSNFGAANTVDAGSIGGHSSLALFAFTLDAIPRGADIQSANLIFPDTSLVGSWPTSFLLGSTTAFWNEYQVTWNSRPSLEGSYAFTLSNGSNSLDVTEILRDALLSNSGELSLGLSANGTANAFIASKESSVSEGASLQIEFVMGRPPLPPAVQAGRTYTLISRYSGKCLDVGASSVNDGALLVQWDCQGVRNQQFVLEDAGRGSYFLKAVHSGKCVDVDGAGLGNGTKVHQWTCNASENQRALLAPSVEGSWKINFAHSGKCLDVSGPSFDNGALLHQWECLSNQANQDWILLPTH